MKNGFDFIRGGTVTSAIGFQAGGIHCGIKNNGSLDLGILFSEADCACDGVFTRNRMKSAHVRLDRERLPGCSIRALVASSGCANAGTGQQGIDNTLAMMAAAAKQVGADEDQMVAASTGVIGKQLPIDRIVAAIDNIQLSKDGGHNLAQAILTTDTVTKEAAVSAGDFTIGGIAKGSGMVHPNLGTLLCFLATDAAIEPGFLSQALRCAVDVSFNMVSIDGDTSPNDTVLLLANGLAGNDIITAESPQAGLFQQALDALCVHLAKAIASDGEGAGKLIEAGVSGAANPLDARAAARTIVASPLVKAAMHGNDPNWGRIVAAAGRSGTELVESKIDLHINGSCLLKGGRLLDYDHKKVAQSLKDGPAIIELNLNLGQAQATAWGCDLSPEYVNINSEYTT